MVCPRCSLDNPKSALACARCGELTPRPTGFVIDTRPPLDGPRQSPLLGRDVPLDRRGRGLRAIGTPPPLRVRPAPPAWSRPVPAPRAPPAPPPRIVTPKALASRGAALRSELHQKRTDPLWQRPPEDDLYAPAVEPPPLEAELEAELVRAPAGRRLAAAALDTLVVAGAALAALVLAAAAFGFARIAPMLERGFDYVLDGLLLGRGLLALCAAFALVTAFVYVTLSHALAGGTLGKRAFGLRVVNRDGERPTFGEAATRTLATALSVAPGGVGLAIALFDPQGLSLHDRLAGTRVVRELAPPAD